MDLRVWASARYRNPFKGFGADGFYRILCLLCILGLRSVMPLINENWLIECWIENFSNLLSLQYNILPYKPWCMCWRFEFEFWNKSNAIPSFGLHITTSIPAINIIKLNMTHCCSSPILPRLLTTPTILFDLLQSMRYDVNKTSNTPSYIYISEIRSLYLHHIPICTDALKQSSHTADVTASTNSDSDEEDN